MAKNVFNVPVFFILFRETTEAAIIIAVLLTFLKRVFEPGSPILKRLYKQVWWGSALGLLICLAIGAAFIAVWYTVLNNLWSSSEDIWEGVFSLIATIMITAMGVAMLRTERMQEQWKLKLAKAMEAKGRKAGFKGWMQQYSFFFLPAITVLREGLEAVVFIGGVSLDTNAESIPLPTIVGIICGCLVGFVIYRGGSLLQLRWFFIISTIILYLVSAGLFSKAIGYFEQNAWNQVIGGESADVIGYKMTTAVWHVSWGDPEANTGETGGWQIFNSILGWNNTATIGTITGYCLYWILIAVILVYMHWREKRQAIDKLNRGEWEEDGDAALDNAKKYVDEQGNLREADSSEKPNLRTESSSSSNAAYNDVDEAISTNSKNTKTAAMV
ncbi:high-affinity iron permease [Mycotypha africana]|uniref:high-affinity iron permease n=1 Tax=Mycotypha africana TaxID=64632 RepID=UPI0023005E51|nr:high-affinity iron permease [Mycotypha africana]KAI8981946.1 high-affinity iron permease [Mycotypha africana]